MKKIIGFIVQKKRLFLLLSLLIASLVVSLKFSSYSWAINPTVKKDGYVKITNIKNGDIIPNKKDVVVEYSADSMTMPMRGARYIGRIRYLILTVNGEPYGTYENTQDKGTYTFQIDLSKLGDETPVKLQALGYLHTAPKSLIRLWEQKKMTGNRLQQSLKSLAQFKSEELGTSKDGNPFDLPKSVNPDTVRIQNSRSSDWIDPTIREPDMGTLKWIKYECNGEGTIVPKYLLEFPSTWKKLGECGDIAFTQPAKTTSISINKTSGTERIKQNYINEGYQCTAYLFKGKNGYKCKGVSKGNSYVHEGDRIEIILLPYVTSDGLERVFEISFLNDKYGEDVSGIWNHLLDSFQIIE